MEIQTRDGCNIPVSISTAPLETATGKLLGGVEILTDLSPVHGLRRRLEESYRFDDITSKNVEMHRIFSILTSGRERQHPTHNRSLGHRQGTGRPGRPQSQPTSA